VIEKITGAGSSKQLQVIMEPKTLKQWKYNIHSYYGVSCDHEGFSQMHNTLNNENIGNFHLRDKKKKVTQFDWNGVDLVTLKHFNSDILNSFLKVGKLTQIDEKGFILVFAFLSILVNV
jgi:hypothetical protein